MADVIITRRGGSSFAAGGPVFGAIETEYPEGAVCSCIGLSRGKKFVVRDEGGKIVFAVPYGDTWRLSAVKGEKSLSEDVIISQSERYKKLRLSFETVYFDGDNPANYSGGWNSTLDSGSKLALSIHGGASTTYDVGIYGTSSEQIPLGDVDKLIITVAERSGCMRAFFYFADEAGGTMGIYAIPNPEQLWELDKGENIIDVRDYDGEYYFGFCIVEAKGSDEPATIKLSRITGE